MQEADGLHYDTGDSDCESECEQVIDLSRFTKLKGLHLTTAGAWDTHCDVIVPAGLRHVPQVPPPNLCHLTLAAKFGLGLLVRAL